MYTTTKSILVL